MPIVSARLGENQAGMIRTDIEAELQNAGGQRQFKIQTLTTDVVPALYFPAIHGLDQHAAVFMEQQNIFIVTRRIVGHFPVAQQPDIIDIFQTAAGSECQQRDEQQERARISSHGIFSKISQESVIMPQGEASGIIILKE